MTSTPNIVIMFYSNRGTMENFIKESKNGFAFDSLSSTEYIANANKLQLSMLAYNFNYLSYVVVIHIKINFGTL